MLPWPRIEANNTIYIDVDGVVDGVVVGELSRKWYVVFCKAKHNVTTRFKSAKSALIKAKSSWNELCQLSAELDDLMEVDEQDFRALRIEGFHNCSDMFAVGGTNFPNSGVTFRQEWIAVPLEDSRAGKAVLMTNV